MIRFALFATLLATSLADATGPHVTPLSSPPVDALPLPITVGGRTLFDARAHRYVSQWPGVYFEGGFYGKTVFVDLGPGNKHLHILIDGALAADVAEPFAQALAITGLAEERHIIRVDIVNENQDAPKAFVGFSVPSDGKPLPIQSRTRQIEFIGDSYTVGYGNISETHQCTDAQIWDTTDTSQSFAAKIAAHLNADYQVNAISGRGLIRNYAGFAADPVPKVYPFTLFDKATLYNDPNWRPQIIVIGLGANDFSTSLGAGEPWATRDALHADFEATYAAFIQTLRQRNPGAFIILLAPEGADGEIKSEVSKVYTQIKARHDEKVYFVSLPPLGLAGCNWHPTVADDDAIATKLTQLISTLPVSWQAK
jgi:lysophospholipase L1-like esterase